MGSRIPSHQLSNGLYVSGRPNHHHLKHPLPTAPQRSAVPYTGGDAKNSGELAKMFDISSSTLDHQNPPPLKLSRSSTSSSSQPNSGSFRSGPHSGPKKTSGPIMTQLQPTGLITSGPLGSSAGSRSEPAAGSGKKPVYGPAVTNLNGEVRLGFKVSKAVMWVVFVAAVMVVVVGAFLMVAVERKEVVAAAGGVLVAVVAVGVWNCAWKEKGLVGFLRRYPDDELRGAVDGQYVKVTGVVTCGSIPLESSFQNVPRCVYVSTELYEYRGWGGKSANPKHRFFSWGRRHVEPKVIEVLLLLRRSELVPLDYVGSPFCKGKWQKSTSFVRTLLGVQSMKMHPLGTNNAKAVVDIVGKKYVADFYVSDFQSGFRAQVKTGYGAKVAPFVKPSTIVDITKGNRELSPSFLQWLTDRSLSSDDRIMRLEEGYIKEGSTVTVMGVVRRHDNVLMIVPPAEPVSSGCQWARFLLPTYIEGLILTCDESQTADVIPV
ncbi:hypothetical protein RHSIM_Rhsim02G0104300 [Rhododendron simsii]|uniref:Ubiquitin-specific protease family C19-related protein n=1 Tax=Rhododendron simsii TaxID=118357 RepID=A0A834H909_RHOSS|nr:hypothetical protein RHSIM_Rhsim02G0104300 [Rhododendron simsii]